MRGCRRVPLLLPGTLLLFCASHQRHIRSSYVAAMPPPRTSGPSRCHTLVKLRRTPASGYPSVFSCRLSQGHKFAKRAVQLCSRCPFSEVTMRFFSSTLGFAFSIMSGIAAFSDAVYNTTTGAEVHVLETFTECDVCPEMVVLPMGEFLMGSTVVEANAARIRFYENQNIDATGVYDLIARSLIGLGIDPDDPEDGLRQLYATGNINREEGPQYFANPFLHEVPQHSVEIDRPIAMGRYEVTRREWAACVEDGGCEIGQSEIPRDEYIGCERLPRMFSQP